MAVILVDMDDVLAKFEQGFLDKWRRRYPDLPFVPLDRRSVFYAEKQYPAKHRNKVRRIIRSPGFFLDLDTVPGGLEAVREMLAAGHDVFLCTAPISDCPTCPTEKTEWVRRHLGADFAKRLIMAPDKTLVRGDFLIDDRPDADQAGILKPVWEHVVFDCPYNRSVGGKRRLVSWQDWRTVLGL